MSVATPRTQAKPTTARALHLESAARPTTLNGLLHDRSDRRATISFEIPLNALPAARSAVELLGNKLADYVKEDHKYAHEDAVTRAIAGFVQPLRAAVCAACPSNDPDFPAL